MKSFSILAAGTFFAATAFSQEALAPPTYGDSTTDASSSASTTVTDLETMPSVIDDLPIITDPLLTTTTAADAASTGVSETTIDGVVYIPKTLCSGGPSASSTSHTLIDPVTTDIGEPSTTNTLIPPVTTAFPSDPSTTLIDPVTTDTSIGVPSDYTTTDIMHPTTTTSADLPPVASATAKIELTKYNERSRKFDIPTDNTLFPLLRHGFKAAFMTVIAAEEGVTCQGFSDKKGNEPLGTPIAMGVEKDDVTNPKDHGMGRESWVRAVKCSPAGGEYESPPIYEPSTTASGSSTTLIEPSTTDVGASSTTNTLVEPSVLPSDASTTLIAPVTTTTDVGAPGGYETAVISAV